MVPVRKEPVQGDTKVPGLWSVLGLLPIPASCEDNGLLKYQFFIGNIYGKFLAVSCAGWLSCDYSRSVE